MHIEVTIQGISPLLMNRFPAEVELQLENGTSSAFNRSAESDTPRGQAEKKAYIDTDGTLYVPGTCIFAMLINAGIFHKVGKNKLTTMKSSLVPAGLIVEDLICSLNTKKWEVDSRSIVNPSTRGRSICHRPRVEDWSLMFTVDVDESMFNEKLVRALVDDAGKKIGLLDFSPRHRGPFGRFVVKKWTRLRDPKPMAEAAQ